MLLHRRRQRLRCHWECWGRNLLLDDDWGRNVDYDRRDGRCHGVCNDRRGSLRNEVPLQAFFERVPGFDRVFVSDIDLATAEAVWSLPCCFELFAILVNARLTE
jgi:hypothetical protein